MPTKRERKKKKKKDLNKTRYSTNEQESCIKLDFFSFTTFDKAAARKQRENVQQPRNVLKTKNVN
jgi:hypothetical protein